MSKIIKSCFLALFIISVLVCAGCPKSSQNPPQSSQPPQQASSPNKPHVADTNKADKPVVLEKTFEIQLQAEPASAEQPSDDKTEYFAVFLGGKKIGHAIQSRTVTDANVITKMDLSITLSRVGAPVTVSTKAVTIETKDGRPLGYETVQNFGLLPSKTVAVVEPNGTVTATIDGQRRQFALPAGTVMSEGMALLLEKNGLKEGTQFTAKMFDPTLEHAVDTLVKVGSKTKTDLLGRVVELTEVTSSYNLGTGNMVSTEYYSDDLRQLKAVTPLMGMNIEQVACTKEFALSANDIFEIIDMMFTASPQPLKNLASVRSIEYQLSPIKSQTEPLNLPQDDNQKVKKDNNGNIILTIEPVSPPTGVEFPYKGSDQIALDALKSSEYIQSDNPKIIALARQAVGIAKDAAQAARNIESFVAGYIENKTLSVGYATALEVANSKQGDCTEFAVLTAAICRAAGIPARVVTGIAYVDDFMGKSGFGGHAWTEVYMGGKWVGLDSAFKSSSRGGYDAGHIALAWGSGAPADFFNLTTTLGRFKIDKVTITAK
jgi:hypothetical protein